MRLRDPQRALVGAGPQPRLAAVAAAPPRPDGMHDLARGQAEPRRDARLARGTAADLAAGREQLGPGGAVDRPVHAAAPEQARVGGVDDRIDGERRDVGLDDLDHVCAT